jgi:Tfp pilus assembly protein PilV
MDIRINNLRRARNRRRGGFTLIEAAMTTVIIGMGVMAMMQLIASGTMNNIQSFEMTTGVNVAKAIREVTLQKTMAQIIAMNNTTHDPPWDSRSQGMSNLAGWQQSIKVQSVNPDNLTQNITDSDPSAVRVTVSVTHNGEKAAELSWYTFRAAH